MTVHDLLRERHADGWQFAMVRVIAVASEGSSVAP